MFFEFILKTLFLNAQGCKEPNTLKPMEIYPVNYTILCYSIIRTWLHVYSDYFGEKYKLTQTTYFQCYFDKLTVMYRNTYLVG